MENEGKRPKAGAGPAGHRRLDAGKLTGQKPALKLKEVWSIRTRLELDGDVAAGGHVKSRGVIIQKKTGRPVQFEITENNLAIDPRAFRRPRAWCRRLSLPEPVGSLASSFDAPITLHRSGLGGLDRAQPGNR